MLAGSTCKINVTVSHLIILVDCHLSLLLQLHASVGTCVLGIMAQTCTCSLELDIHTSTSYCTQCTVYVAYMQAVHVDGREENKAVWTCT